MPAAFALIVTVVVSCVICVILLKSVFRESDCSPTIRTRAVVEQHSVNTLNSQRPWPD